MSKSPKHLVSQFMLQKKLLLKSNVTKRNKIILKTNRLIPYANSRRQKVAKPTHAHNKSLNITKNIENVALTINNSQRRDKRVAKSVEFRKKENGNYIASIYPPEYALARPRKINEAIEMELIEFMQENEEKFKKSQMNHNFVFPRKYILSTNSSYNNDEF